MIRVPSRRCHRDSSQTVLSLVRFHLLAFLLFLLIAFPYPSSSPLADDETPVGSIQGRVYDKETGESVVFADVILVGTGKGMISSADGTFRFVQVPEGIYQVRVFRMGYATELMDQVRVQAGYSKKLSIGLAPIAVRELEKIEIIGDRKLVDVEVAKTSHMVTSEEIKSMAVTVVDDVVGKQTGVVQDDDGLYVRGGRASDTVYRVDGVVIRDLITGRSSAGNISARSIKKVEIITGGFDAEYGQALAGVIDIETKEGSEEFHGYAEFQSDHLGIPTAVSEDTNLDKLEIQIEGEEPIQRWLLKPLGIDLPGKLTIFADVSANIDDTNLPVAAEDGSDNTLRSSYDDQFLWWNIDYAGNFWTPRARNRWSGLYKISWQPNGKNKLFLSFQKKLEIDHGFFRGSLVSAVDPGEPTSSYNYEWSRRKDHDYTNTDDSNTMTLDWRHIWNNRVKTTVRLSRAFNSFFQNVYGKSWFEYEQPDDADLPDSLDIPFFVDTGDNDVWHSRYTEAYVGYFDINYKRGETHDFKGGLEFSRESLQFITIAEPWVKDPDGLGRNHDLWRVNPMTGALFVQDKFQYEGFIGNVGVRYDYWFPGSEAEKALRDETRASYNEELVKKYEEDSHAFFGGNRVKGVVAPRFQVSHPVTNSSHLFFNYGHFSQRPNYYYVYSKISSVSSEDFPLIGNLTLNPMRTVKYELGARHLLADDLAVDFSVYYNDFYDYPKSLTFERPGLPTYFVYVNEDFSRSRGIEIEVRKKRSKYLWARFAYTYMIATGKSSDPTQHNLLQEEVGAFTQIGRDEEYLYWNRPHKLTLDLTLSVGKTQTPPTVFGWTMPRDWSLNTYIWMQSGRAYTPVNELEEDVADRYSANAPMESTVDLRFRKGFPIGSRRASFLLEIRDLFASIYPKRIDSVTGTGYVVGEGSLVGDVTEYEINRYSDPSFNDMGRSVRVGVSSEF